MDFISKEMKLMVAKICYEWLNLICTTMDPLSPEYSDISDSIYKNTINEDGYVDVMTNIDIAKAIFEDLNNLKIKNNSASINPKRLVVGNYILYFEIKNGRLFCYFAFMGLILYRVFITSKNLPDTSKTILLSPFHIYSGRTGELTGTSTFL